MPILWARHCIVLCNGQSMLRHFQRISSGRISLQKPWLVIEAHLFIREVMIG